MLPATRDEKRSKVETTRIIPTIPGGPTIYADNDGTIDVKCRDPFGRSWYMYRAAEGKRWCDSKAGENTNMRGTGLIQPPGLPSTPFMGLMSWHMHAVEADVLMGRRGVLGWDGSRYAPGLKLREVDTFWGDVLDWWNDQSHLDRWVIGTMAAAAAAGVIVLSGGSALAVGGGALAISGGLAMYEYGGYRRDTYGADDTGGRALQMGGKLTMGLGAFAMAQPVMGLLGAGLGKVLPAGLMTAGKVGMGIVAGGYMASRIPGMYNDFRDPNVDYIEWGDRHGLDAVIMARIASAGGRALLRGLPAAIGLGMSKGSMTQGQRNLLAKMIRYARSDAFRANAKSVSFTDAQIRALPRRLLEYGKAGQVQWTLSPVSQITTGGIRISRFGSRKTIFHEMGHLLDDIANPGLLARESSLSYAEIVAAEQKASIIQLGKRNWRTTVIPHAAALQAKYHLVTALTYVALAGFGLTLYKTFWKNE